MRRPSPALAVALLALVLAMSGAAYAVITAPKNSVVSRSIKNGQVKRADLGLSAVNGARVADRSLGAGELAPGVLRGEAARFVAPNPLQPADPCDTATTGVFCGWFDSDPVDGNWHNVGAGRAPVAFRRDSGGVVHLEGVATMNSPQTTLVVFILPPAYRPSATHLFSTQCWDSDLTDNGPCIAAVEPDGEIRWHDPQIGIFPRGGMTLDGIEFRAG